MDAYLRAFDDWLIDKINIVNINQSSSLYAVNATSQDVFNLSQ